MKKSITKYCIIFLLLLIFISIFNMSDKLVTIIKSSCTIWLYNLVPSMFPFFILTDLLVNYGFIDILAFLFKKPIKFLFNVSENASFVIFFSLLTGFPSSAKYCKSLLENDLISLEDANKIICFTHFSNPLFIINVIGIIILNSQKLGIFILISHYLSNIIIGILLRNKPTKNIDRQNSLTTKPLANVLTESFLNSFNSLLIVLGSLITFQLLTAIIYNYIPLNQNLKVVIGSFLEITQGLFALKNLNIAINIKALIASSIISFGGICIHMQVNSILHCSEIKYKRYLLCRALQAIISPIIMFILLSYCI